MALNEHQHQDENRSPPPTLKPRQFLTEPHSPTSISATSAASHSPIINRNAPVGGALNPRLENGHHEAEKNRFAWYRRFFRWRDSKPYTKRLILEEIFKPVDSYPSGYGKVAAELDTDPNFLVYRKFGWLHNFVLLDLQDEIQVLEKNLEELCNINDEEGEHDRLRSREQDYSRDHSRKELIRKIHRKILTYDELLLQTQKVQALKRPSKRYQSSVGAFVTNEQRNGFPNITNEEAEWIYRSDDLALVSLDTERGWLNSVIEDSLAILSPWLLHRVFRTKELKIRTGNEARFDLVDPFRIDVLVRIIVTVVATVELLGPLPILVSLQTDEPQDFRRNAYLQILTIFVSTLIFSASCSIFTKARRQEVFGATAAYCATQVVFLGNYYNSSSTAT